MQAADRILDMGPGPGSAGGQLVFEGSLDALRRSGESLTGAYLRGDRSTAKGHLAAALLCFESVGMQFHVAATQQVLGDQLEGSCHYLHLPSQ